MPDVDGPMDLLIHLLVIPIPQGKYLYDSRAHFKILKSILLQEGHFTKVRILIGIKGTSLP